MAQHDYNIANQSGADFRADLNNALSAIATVNSGASEPSTTFAHQLWVDTSNNVLKIRNAANSAFITTGVSITASNTFAGNLTGNADTATTLATARTINGVSFDGSANISFNTDSVAEGSSNLYFTNERVDDQVNALLQAGTGIQLTYDDTAGTLTIANTNDADITGVVAGNALTGGGTSGSVTLNVAVDDSSIEIDSDALRVKASGITNTMLAGSIANSKLANSSVTINSQSLALGGTLVLDTDNIGEGSSNLYYTDARVNSAFDTRLATKDTGDLSEGSNLYYTTARVNSDFDTRLGTKSTSDLAEGTNLYYTTARFDSAFTSKDTDDLSEGTTNLYYTTTRFDSAFGNKTTADLTENTNLYYTDTRANSAIDARVTKAFVDALGIQATSVAANSVALGTDTTGNYVETITGTANKITVSGSGSESANITLTLPDDVQIADSLTVAGNLTVNGTLTSLDTTNLDIEDNLFQLNAGLTGSPVNDSGMLINRGNQNNGIFMWDESADKFTMGLTTADGSATGNITLDSLGTLVANLEGNVTGNVTGQVSDISNFTTANLTENTNLYYTQARFDSAFTAKSTSDLSEGTNLYYTDARFDTRLASKDTDDVSEGTSNLYYTSARFNSAFGGKSTSDLSEGTNLYYTDARVQAVSINNVVEDTTPQLGGDLDLNSSDITGTGDINITGAITSSGKLVAGRTSAYGSGKIQSFVNHTSSFGSPSFVAADSTAMAAGVGGEIGFYGKYSAADDYAFYGGIKGFKENGTDSNTACALSFHTRPNATAAQEVMRISSSGNLLVGKTSTSSGVVGHRFNPDGSQESTTNGGLVAYFNRKTSDGEIVRFDKDGSEVGSIGTASGDLYLDSTGGELSIKINGTTKYEFDASQFYSKTDGQTSLGVSSNRFNNLHLSGTAYVDTAVGIGNSSPSTGYRLDITGQSGYDDIMRLTAVGTNIGARINLTNTGTGVARINATNNSLALQTGGTEAMRIDNNQNLLVARTSNSGFGKLQVYGGADLAGGNVLLCRDTGNVGIGVTSPSSYDSRSNNLVVGDSGDAGITIFSGATSNARLQFAPSGSTGLDNGLIDYDNNNDSMAFATGGSERMRIDSSGDVRLAANATGAALVKGVSGDQTSRNVGGYPQFTFVGNEGTGIRRPITNVLAFDTSGDERMRIDDSGNVGIGGGPSSTIRNDGSAAEKALQIGTRAMFFSDGGVTTDLQNNSHLNNSDLRVAMQTDAGSLYQQYQGVHRWLNAASVSAGATQSMVERMRIDASGNFSVGTTQTPATLLSDGHQGVGVGNDGFIVSSRLNDIAAYFKRENSNGNVVSFLRDAASVGTISVTGSATSYNTSSDARLKDITGEARGLEVINELNPVAYNWKADGKADEGLIAQEVLDIVPNAVSGSEEDMYQMDYSKLVVHLVAGMKEQQEQIEALQSEINLLKGE